MVLSHTRRNAGARLDRVTTWVLRLVPSFEPGLWWGTSKRKEGLTSRAVVKPDVESVRRARATLRSGPMPMHMNELRRTLAALRVASQKERQGQKRWSRQEHRPSEQAMSESWKHGSLEARLLACVEFSKRPDDANPGRCAPLTSQTDAICAGCVAMLETLLLSAEFRNAEEVNSTCLKAQVSLRPVR